MNTYHVFENAGYENEKEVFESNTICDCYKFVSSRYSVNEIETKHIACGKKVGNTFTFDI